MGRLIGGTGADSGSVTLEGTRREGDGERS